MANFVIGAFLAATLGVLVFIAIQLRAIVRELSRRSRASARENDQGGERSSGPTINVNLAPGSSPVLTSTESRPRMKNAVTDRGDAAAGPESEPAGERQGPGPEMQAKPLSVICPRCKQENSSYRIECYNCGNSL
jgi:hypothetical protein